MSPLSPSQNVADLCRQLDEAVGIYRAQLEAKAHAESDYKRDRAKRVMKARADGEKAVAGAELIADADDTIAQARLTFLLAEGMVAATKAQIGMLTERIGFGRSLLASEREQDRLHSQNRAQA